MTVQQMIAALSKFPPDAEVMVNVGEWGYFYASVDSKMQDMWIGKGKEYQRYATHDENDEPKDADLAL